MTESSLPKIKLFLLPEIYSKQRQNLKNIKLQVEIVFQFCQKHCTNGWEEIKHSVRKTFPSGNWVFIIYIHIFICILIYVCCSNLLLDWKRKCGKVTWKNICIKSLFFFAFLKMSCTLTKVFIRSRISINTVEFV